MIKHIRLTASAMALTAGMVAAVAPAAARDYGPHGYGRAPAGYVIAESSWGNGSISGAVRHGRHGLQVQLPRGTWIDCVRSCSDTLRRETIDFWESHGPQSPGSGRGYLGFEFRY